MLRKISLGLALILLLVGLASCSTQEPEDPKLLYLSSFFEGEEVNYAEASRDYDWYIDQAKTGPYSHSNCGPSSVVMAMKWLDKDFQGTAEEAREEHFLNGGWWYTSIVSKYFSDREVGLNYLRLDNNIEETTKSLKEAIDEGKIALMCLNMDYISKGKSQEPFGRFYDYDDGHFLIVKGYLEAGDQDFFEVYDPNNWDMEYEDGQPLGKDRFYRAEGVILSALDWYEFAFIIRED